jgi:glycosyltransferase involved in cell wall biosynthesis
MNGVSSVQVVIRNSYIEATEVQHYYTMSDVILTTYQNHMGSSSALIRAALAKKPVLSSDFGLMGHLVRTRKLGRVCDSTSPQAIAAGIEQMLESNLSNLTDSVECDRLVAENSEQQLGNDLARLEEFLPVVGSPPDRRAVLS